MKSFFERYQILIGIVIVGLLISVAIVISGNANLQIYLGGETDKEAINEISSEAVVTKVIDGDTVVIESGNSVRLLGIDADERGHICYDAAKTRLEELVLMKQVHLESDIEDSDQYGRFLRYIFVGDANINLKLVEEGMAIALFYQPNTKYRQEIALAEQQAKQNRTGCKWVR
ncbi:MAG: thermonuclease family protein [Candidatus Colwellbacteria bacterium]|nr:thermonuclease family protein [Candidatus Colwellbacteria bacterium]